MTPERWQRIKEVLAAAVAQTEPDRAAYLEAACAGDTDLRGEVESLLASHDAAGDVFLETPVAVLSSPADRNGGGAAKRIGQRIGAYHVVGELGHGGMSDVFAAVRADGHYEKRVALKLVRAGYATAGILDRFRAERQILAGLEHPNIGRLLDGGTTDDGVPYLVMELVDGAPLDAFCQERALPVRDRLELFLQVCSAVEFAHRRLVVHRDIKPANILVGSDGIPKLLDFGIAKLLDPEGRPDETGLRPFTPEYASPEQIRGEPVSTTTDVYALGVVLYKLLTGRSPYRLARHTAGELADAITAQAPERLESHLRGNLDGIVSKALRKEPESRYPSVEQFAEDIRRYLDGRPVAARKGSWSYRTGKFVRRHKAGAAAAAIVFVSLVTGIIVTLREARIAEANRQRADARFNDVRKLANSLIFEVHDSIQNLPGATDARKLILQRAVEYLDSLAKETANEPDLLRELASGYGRIAELQGNPFTQQLGDTKAALASYQKSVALRESLARSYPGNVRDQIELARAYHNYGEFEIGAAGQLVTGFEYAKRSLAIVDRLARVAPDDLQVLDLSTSVLESLGLVQEGTGLMATVGSQSQGLADLERALQLTRHAIELSPKDAGLVAREGALEAVTGESLLKLGDRAAALGHYQRALAALAPLVQSGRQLGAALNTAVVYGKAGDALLIDGKARDALPFYQESAKLSERLAEGDPHNESAQRQEASAFAELGHDLVELGRTAEGMSYILRAVARMEADATDTPLTRSVDAVIRGWLGEALERQDRIRDASHEYAITKERLGAIRGRSENSRIQGFFGAATARLAATFVKLGDTDRAVREYEEARAVLEPALQAAPGEYEVAYVLAETYSAEGNIALTRAERTRLRSEQIREYQLACDWFDRSLNIWTAVPHPARISTSGFEVTLPADVSRLRARCASGLLE